MAGASVLSITASMYLSGSFEFPYAYRESNSTINLSLTDHIVIKKTGGTSITYNLPLASDAKAGKVYIFKKIPSGGSLVINANVVDQIEGASTLTTSTQNASLQIVSDGANDWYVIAKDGTWT